MLRLDRITLENYRCFRSAQLELEPDVTLLHAENAGGKTAMLNALATGLGCWFNPAPVTLDRDIDLRQVRSPLGSWEPAGDCWLEYRGLANDKVIQWRRDLSASGGRTSNRGVKALREIAGETLNPGQDWPILAYYGTQRLWQAVRGTRQKASPARRRWDGYLDCLDPRSSETQLLDWMNKQAIVEAQRHERGEPRLGLLDAVARSMERATPGVTEIRFDLTLGEPRVRFTDRNESGWSQLSDGYHVFLALVADIARRAVTLNDHLGVDAPLRTTGVVLIDEIDLHLHPRWQRGVVAGLRAAFPHIQFVLTTHSPQVLGSVENRQVRGLADGAVSPGPFHVQDRDSNAILLDVMGNDRQSPAGRQLLRELAALVDARQIEPAERKLAELRDLWGPTDVEVVRAETMLDWQR